MDEETKKGKAGCAGLMLMAAVPATSVGVSFLAGPGAGFLVFAALCALWGLALACDVRRGRGGGGR